MSKQMKEVIEHLKAQNGNSDISQKDMLWYLVHKVDKIHERIDGQVNHCNGHFAPRKLLYTITGISFALVAAVISFLSTMLN